MGKASKYLHYIKIISASPERKRLLKELLKEIRRKGIITGIQSFLHQKIEYFFPGYDKNSPYEPILSLDETHEHLKIILPFAPTPKVSIVIPTYNQLEHVYYCVRAILVGAGFTD